jgi:hypothetical protein
MRRWFIALIGLYLLVSGVWGIARVIAQEETDNGVALTRTLAQKRPQALKKAADTVEAFKAKAIKAGRYRCCLKHPCDFCALKMGTCPCDDQLAAGKPVCNECKGGWYAGDGEAKGKTADEIKTFPRTGAMEKR